MAEEFVPVEDSIALTEEKAKEKKKKKTDLQSYKIHLDDIRSVLSTPQGRRFVGFVFDLSGMLTQPYTGTSRTFFNNGKAEVGLELLDHINQASEDAFIQVLKETMERTNARSRTR